jgi:hypothetical protein
MVYESLEDYKYSGITLERQKCGWYVFGTQKVFIEILNERLSVRVGGGYTFMANFLKEAAKLVVPIKPVELDAPDPPISLYLPFEPFVEAPEKFPVEDPEVPKPVELEAPASPISLELPYELLNNP